MKKALPRDVNPCIYVQSTCRSSPPELFLEKSVLKICSKFAGEKPCRSGIPVMCS